MTRVEDIHTALNSRLNTAESVPLNTEGKENIHRLILGKVLKMLGDDTALVQIGSTKIKAQLAAQLKADSFYWFQLEQEGGGSLSKLRPVQQFDQDPKTLKDAAAKLLEGLSLKNGLEQMLTATAFLKEKPVINEAELKTAVKWIEQLQGADIKKGLASTSFCFKERFADSTRSTPINISDEIPLYTSSGCDSTARSINTASEAIRSHTGSYTGRSYGCKC
nr:hypothetical protein [Bacillus altitudinis]